LFTAVEQLALNDGKTWYHKQNTQIYRPITGPSPVSKSKGNLFKYKKVSI